MLGYLGVVALDVANQKAREAEAIAERHRLSRLAGPRAESRPALPRPGRRRPSTVQQRVALGQ